MNSFIGLSWSYGDGSEPLRRMAKIRPLPPVAFEGPEMVKSQADLVSGPARVRSDSQLRSLLAGAAADRQGGSGMSSKSYCASCKDGRTGDGANGFIGRHAAIPRRSN